MRFACGSAAELHLYDRLHIGRPRMECGIFQQQAVPFVSADGERSFQFVAGESLADYWDGLRFYPFRQAFACGFRPLVFLAAAVGQFAVADQVREQVANVVGEVEVFGETVDDARQALDSDVPPLKVSSAPSGESYSARSVQTTHTSFSSR